MEEHAATHATRRWVESFVIGLNLCPFARRELVRDRIRFVASGATSIPELLSDLEAELALLALDPSVGTTLLIHPAVLADFFVYLDFLDVAQDVLVEQGYEGDIQIASFHPDYQFEGTLPEDVSNCTNQSPYPMLHLIREADIERAVESYPDIEDIPARNIRLMQQMGREQLRAYLTRPT